MKSPGAGKITQFSLTESRNYDIISITMMKRSSRKRLPREDGPPAERPSVAQCDEGRFGVGWMNGVVRRGAPLKARRGLSAYCSGE